MTAVSSTQDARPMPEAVELCARVLDGHRCLGVIFRPQPDRVYCIKCGGRVAGVRYTRAPQDGEGPEAAGL